ncbi:MAG TPA: 3-deoxy-D-manno-octulosonate 8-phosphate phosphatase [Calditrichaeota bacterium]|nr:3-deoxy-D-manno-octulosonate 8-phosphate phosphatase [Calditrichota bacterium]
MKSKLVKIKLILMDVDGVLTDGEIIYSSDGAEIKKFNVQDGMGITLARMAGLKTGIITGRISEMVKRRAEELKFDIVSQGSFNKLPRYEQIKQQFNLTDEEIAYIGDDILDLSILKKVGFSAAVANARDEVKAICDYVTIHQGGQGAVREVIDKILIRQDKLGDLIKQLSK